MVAWISIGSGHSSVSSSAKLQWSNNSGHTLGYRTSVSKSMTRRAEIIYKVRIRAKLQTYTYYSPAQALMVIQPS